MLLLSWNADDYIFPSPPRGGSSAPVHFAVTQIYNVPNSSTDFRSSGLLIHVRCAWSLEYLKQNNPKGTDDATGLVKGKFFFDALSSLTLPDKVYM